MPVRGGGQALLCYPAEPAEAQCCPPRPDADPVRVLHRECVFKFPSGVGRGVVDPLFSKMFAFLGGNFIAF